MLANYGKTVEKKGKESRKWATLTEGFFFEQSQGQNQQTWVKLHSWPRLQIGDGQTQLGEGENEHFWRALKKMCESTAGRFLR